MIVPAWEKSLCIALFSTGVQQKVKSSHEGVVLETDGIVGHCHAVEGAGEGLVAEDFADVVVFEETRGVIVTLGRVLFAHNHEDHNSWQMNQGELEQIPGALAVAIFVELITCERETY